MKARTIALLVLVVSSLGMAPFAAAQAEEPYSNETVDAEEDQWMEGVDAPSVESVAHMLSRVGTFVVGSDPSDPGLAPLISSIVVVGVVLGAVGTTRAGVVASGVMGITTLSVLSIGGGLLPEWIYGTAVIALAVMAVSVINRFLR